MPLQYPSRDFLIHACAVLLACAAGAVCAQGYPEKPIRIVVPFPAGGGSDIVTRAISPRLSTALGQPVIVDNRAGADGMIGSAMVAKAPADGYLLLMASTGPMVIGPALETTMPYDTVRDFAPITQAITQPMALVIHSALPVDSVAKFIALAKARPGEINYGSAGVGNGTHLAAEIFRSLTGVNIVHVPYKGTAPAVNELLGGHVQAIFTSVSVLLPHVRSGRLRALAIGGQDRLSILPNVPTMKEAGVPGFDASSWYGLFAPAGTPSAIVSRLNAEAVKVLRSAEIRDLLQGQGADPVGNTVEAFMAHIKAELAKWQKAVRDAGVKPH